MRCWCTNSRLAGPNLVSKLPDFVGPYRLARFIRSGNATQIWEAIKDDGSGRYVLKILRSQNWGNKKEIGFLKHEFNVAHKVDHPSVIRIMDFDTEGKIGYLVLELFSDLNIKQFMRERGRDILLVNFQHIFEQCVLSLQKLHDQKWVHCDVKPDNYLISDDFTVKLIDFTISQKMTRGTFLAMFRKKAQIQGTRSFMSPEQIRGEPLDGRADIYSVGCVGYELLTGKLPFTGTSPNDLLNNHLRAPIPSIQVHNDNVTPAMNQLIASMMAKDPDQRPNSMLDVLKMLKTLRPFKQAPQVKEAETDEADDAK